MESNILLAGVGGQGILSIAFVIDNAALDAGLRFKQAEVHGMAQRGGAVQSHLRLASDVVHSDLVPEGRADLVLSVEPLESLRYTHYLSPQGVTITSLTPFVNISNYPDLDSIFARLLSLPRLVALDAERLAREAGTTRAQNMVVLGAAVPYLPLDIAALTRYVERLFVRKGAEVVQKNLAAFHAGRHVGAFFTTLLESGVAAADTLALIRVASGLGIEPDSAVQWQRAFAGPRGRALATELAAADGKTLVTLDAATALRAAEAPIL